MKLIREVFKVTGLYLLYFLSMYALCVFAEWDFNISESARTIIVAIFVLIFSWAIPFALYVDSTEEKTVRPSSKDNIVGYTWRDNRVM